MTCSTLIADFI